MNSTSEASPTRSVALTLAAGAVLILTAVVVALCVTEAAGVAAPPHSNARVIDGEVTVYAIAAGDIFDQAGLEAGDRILSINGVTFETGKAYIDYMRSIRPGDHLWFEVGRDDEQLNLQAIASANLQPSRLVAVGFPILVLLLAGGGVFFAAPRSWTTFLFLLFCCSAAVNDACQLPLVGGASAAQITIMAAYTLFSIQSPALGLHLFILFPARSGVQRWLTAWLPFAYGIQTILGLSYFLPAVSSGWAAKLTNPQLHPTLLGLFNANVVICSALSALSLAAVAIGRDQERVRQQARLLFFGFALLTTFQLTLYTLPLRFLGRMLVSAESYMLLDLIVPAFVVAAILLHRLWNIDLLVRQGFIYGAASVVVAMTFTAAVIALGSLAKLVWPDPDIVVIAAATAVAVLLFQPIQKRTRRWVDRSLYRKHYSHHLLIAEIGEQLAAMLDLPAIAMLLHTRIMAALEPETLVVTSYRTPPETIRTIDRDGAQEMLCSGDEAKGLAEELLSRRQPFQPDSGSCHLFGEYEVVVPMVRGDQVLGAILLGARQSNVPYFADDLNLLAAISRETAPVLDNARLIEERADRERLVMVGTATAAITHELKNPLAAIKSTAAILRRRLDQDPRGQELTDVVVEEVDRLEKSALDVLTFARPKNVDPTPIALVELVTQLIGVVRPDFARSGVEVRLKTDLPPLALLGDAERLRQALLNLLLNARDAMTSGGVVGVELRPWQDDTDGVRGVEIRVVDSGPGFPEHILPKAFEPFVSSKRLGTGLGLANVRQVVEEHGGQVDVRNCPGSGAEVCLFLPCTPGVRSAEHRKKR
ncbi:MAG: PDZ domain-containing protein [Thermoanaerobaculales bacterium]|nr:PDZ domain-containing protein [Thermoanaerobaculales bacterium]